MTKIFADEFMPKKVRLLVQGGRFDKKHLLLGGNDLVSLLSILPLRDKVLIINNVDDKLIERFSKKIL